MRSQNQPDRMQQAVLQLEAEREDYRNIYRRVLELHEAHRLIINLEARGQALREAMSRYASAKGVQ